MLRLALAWEFHDSMRRSSGEKCEFYHTYLYDKDTHYKYTQVTTISFGYIQYRKAQFSRLRPTSLWYVFLQDDTSSQCEQGNR